MREALRHPDLDFEAAEVHHGEHRAVRDYAGALCHVHLAHLAIEGCTQSQCIDLASRFGHHRALSLGQQLLVVRVEVGAIGLQLEIILRGVERDGGALHQVLRACEVVLRHRAARVGLLVAFQVALCGSVADLGLFECLARIQARHFRIQLGAIRTSAEAGEGGFFLHQLAAQFGAVDDGERLALLHLVAGYHRELHGTGRDGVERGTVRSDHAAISGEIAHQVATRDGGDAQALGAERARTGDPLRDHPADGHHQQRGARDGHHPARAAPTRAVPDFILRGGIADHVPGTARRVPVAGGWFFRGRGDGRWCPVVRGHSADSQAGEDERG